MAVNPVSVSQLNAYIRRVLGTDPLLGDLAVRGEISNLKFHSSGHVYFSLKDSGAKINCFLPADRLSLLEQRPEEGLAVVIFGYVSVYEKGGYYSLNVRQMRAEGQGDLSRAFEALKQKLKAEGLFDTAHKKKLPAHPKRIAVLTSPTGAAVHDIIRTVRLRSPLVDLLVYPCPVQGPGAAEALARAVAEVNARFSDVDLIILGRGGGSIEELWAFNEEVLARAIYASRLPVISAVGHETDFTISDFTADLRAATPTAAAQLAVPDAEQLAEECEDLRYQLLGSLRQRLLQKEHALMQCNLPALRALLQSRVQRALAETDRSLQRLRQGREQMMLRKTAQLEQEKTRLEALDPLDVLARGFAVVESPDGRIIASAAGLAPGHALTVRWKDGKILGKVEEVLES